jgi:formylglycine-generating enzyme required for sulfatase activity
MNPSFSIVLARLMLGSLAVGAQEPTLTSPAGIELVLIKPGSMIVGKFQPPYPKPVDPNAPPPAARGGGGGRGAGATVAPVMLSAADANHDERLSKDEMTGLANAWFDTLDPDKAGKMTPPEFTPRFAALLAGPNPGAGPVGSATSGTPPTAGAPAAAPGGPGGAPAGAGGGRGGGRGGVGPTFFTAADTNKDGVLTREEFRVTLEKWFGEWDTAKTGSLTLDQLAAGLTAAVPQPAGGRGTPLSAADYKRAEDMAKADSTPGFSVTITRPFYIGKYEVTQAQWARVMGTNPAVFQGDKVTDDAGRHPVENITWDDAQAFIKKLNALEKTNAYRLPTEVEWEYAARAGGDADIPWTAIREQAIAGYNSFTSTHVVGEKKPNAWGLYDVMGNVWEWVQDYYNEKIFADPTPPKTGTMHVLKGGGFAADVKNAIPATHAAGPGSKFDVGLRVVRDIR